MRQNFLFVKGERVEPNAAHPDFDKYKGAIYKIVAVKPATTEDRSKKLENICWVKVRNLHNRNPSGWIISNVFVRAKVK